MRLNPLRGIPNQRQIWAWASYDVANQSFTLLINTLFFALFFKKVVVNDPRHDELLWSVTVAASLLLVVIIAPVAGAVADFRAWKKGFLIGTGIVCSLLTCALAFLGPGMIWPAILLYVPANAAYALGENFLASFIPEVSPKEHIGRVSGLGWTTGYLAALLLLVIAAAIMFAFNLRTEAQWPPFFVFAGLWFLVLAAPTMLYLRERPADPASAGTPASALLAVGFRRLFETARSAAHYRQLALFLAAFFVFGIGMQTIIFFASIIAGQFGFQALDLVIFITVITVTAGLGTILPMLFQDRFGHRNTVAVFLAVWTITTLTLALVAWLRASSPDPDAFPRWPMWLIGNLIGFGLGGLGTASRSLVGYFTPSHKTAEFFGLWGLVFKLAGVMTILYGVAADRIGQVAALGLLAGFFVVGLVLTLFVDEQAGLDAARRAEAAERDRTGAPR
ncbi:MAG: MFS transporter [Phycisphaerales bacterium]|nr:MFS transporter [Phycisphaerales bacterium]